MVRPCLLSAKPQSFAPQLELFPQPSKNYPILLLQVSNDVLMLYGTQIFQFDSETLQIKEEILLDSPIEAFNFDHTTLTLRLKQPEISDSPSLNSRTSDSQALDPITVTSKYCTWSFDCPNRTISLDFFNSQLSCKISDAATNNLNSHLQSVLENIKGDHVAAIINNQLQILDKTDCRSLVSSAPLIHTGQVQSLLWIHQFILVFTINYNILHVSKYHLMNFVTPTNVRTFHFTQESKVSLCRDATGQWLPGHVVP